MKKIRKRWMALAAAAAAAAAVLLVSLVPRPMFSKSGPSLVNRNGNSEPIYFWGYYWEQGSGKREITSLLDQERLLELLKEAEVNYSRWMDFPIIGGYETKDYPLELSCIDEGPVHLLFGKHFYYYRSADKMAMTILDGEKIYREILEMIEAAP